MDGIVPSKDVAGAEETTDPEPLTDRARRLTIVSLPTFTWAWTKASLMGLIFSCTGSDRVRNTKHDLDVHKRGKRFYLLFFATRQNKRWCQWQSTASLGIRLCRHRCLHD